MKLHNLMASAAALAFATGAIAQDAASPATPDSSVSGSTSADVVAPDAAASSAAASSGEASTSMTAGTSADPSMAATPSAADAASAVAAPATDAASAAAAPATDAASAAAAPSQMGAADTQSAMTTPADPAKVQAADQMIAQNWGKYDEGNKGQLTPLEFGTWVMAAQGNDMTAQVEKSRHSKASNLPSTKVLNATSAEFSKADTNKDRQVSQEELKAYLSA